MEITLFLIFVFGYLAITLEHALKIDKLIPALLMMSLSWAIIMLGLPEITNWLHPEHGLIDVNGKQFVPAFTGGHEEKLKLVESTLLHHFGKTAEILIFLMGAMAIVEMIDFFEGFGTIRNLINSKKKVTLLWIISLLAFVLSAVIDNLTATIVLISVLRKIIPHQEDRIWYASFVVIAANAGGAWTPIGDVTTTMLWMAGKVSTQKLATYLLIPSLVCVLLPLIAGSFLKVFKGEMKADKKAPTKKHASLMLILGLILIVFVPVFKTITHLPPYIGMMFSLAIYAIIAEYLSNRRISLTGIEGEHLSHSGPTMKALSKIEMPSVLFFLGILMTVAAMESTGMIFNFGQQVKSAGIAENLFVTLLGIASAIVDNVPLVAASMGMFNDANDASVWHLIAYSAGTGGSMLIIGSAAGVVAMGMEKISFVWYLKHISWLAALGFFAGIGCFLLFH